MFYLLVFDRIHDAMCLNNMSRTSSRNIGWQHKTYSSNFIVHMGYFLSLCSPNPSWVFAAKSSVLVSSDHRSQSHLKFQSCLITEYAGVSFFFVFLETLPNSMWWCRGCLIIFFKVFWDSTIFCNSQLWSLESLWPLKLSSSPCIRTI